MAKLAWIFIVACSAAMIGCAVKEPRMAKPELRCDGTGVCKVDVTVECTLLSCAADINFDPIVVNNRRRELDIFWELPSHSDYEFAENGIEFPKSREEFRCSRQNKHRFVCRNLHRDFGVHKYTVNVRGPRHVPPYDPWVVND
jgi:hypothetical protein